MNHHTAVFLMTPEPLNVHSLVEGTALSPNVCYQHWSSVENLHSQLKLTGNFEPQGKHPNAISRLIYSRNLISHFHTHC